MRTPNELIMRYKPHINVAALCGGAVGLMTTFDARYQLIGAAILIATFLAWILLVGRVTPRASDYLEYLKHAAEKEGVATWLSQVDAEFKLIWGIESLEDVWHD